MYVCLCVCASSPGSLHFLSLNGLLHGLLDTGCVYVTVVEHRQLDLGEQQLHFPLVSRRLFFFSR